MLTNIISKFEQNHLFPKIGIEIEFYIDDERNLSYIANFIDKLNMNIQLVKEIGENQYEIIIPPSSDILPYIKLCNLIRDYLTSQGAILKTIYKEDLPPNSMHLHINLLNNYGNNAYIRNGSDYNKLIQYSIAGLCNLMQESILFMLPFEEDYKRFSKCPPVNVSWGANNRTTALRLPENIPENFRIEYRIISPEAELENVIAIILIGILHGIKNKLSLPEKIYSLAQDLTYLPKLPETLGKSNEYFLQYKTLKDYLKFFA